MVIKGLHGLTGCKYFLMLLCIISYYTGLVIMCMMAFVCMGDIKGPTKVHSFPKKWEFARFLHYMACSAYNTPCIT